MGHGFSVAHACVLASQLPRESRCLSKLNPDLAWSDETAVLLQIEYLIRCLIWSLGGGKGAKPQPVQTPSETADLRTRLEASADLMEEVARELGISDQ